MDFRSAVLCEDVARAWRWRERAECEEAQGTLGSDGNTCISIVVMLTWVRVPVRYAAVLSIKGDYTSIKLTLKTHPRTEGDSQPYSSLEKNIRQNRRSVLLAWLAKIRVFDYLLLSSMWAGLTLRYRRNTRANLPDFKCTEFWLRCHF